MVRIDFTGTRFGSQLDEDHMFKWGLEIAGTLRWEQDTLQLRSKRLSNSALRDLVALLWRYRVPMQQLAVFLTPQNRSWFTDSQMYWHTEVFARHPNKRLQRTRAGANSGDGASRRPGRKGARR